MEALIESVISAEFRSCGNEGECSYKAIVTRFKGLAVVPDLIWTIKKPFVSGDNTIIVRGGATGTPVKTFLG